MPETEPVVYVFAYSGGRVGCCVEIKMGKYADGWSKQSSGGTDGPRWKRRLRYQGAALTGDHTVLAFICTDH